MKTYKYNNVVKTITKGSFMLLGFDSTSNNPEHGVTVIFFNPVKGTWSQHGKHFCVSSSFDPMSLDWESSYVGITVQDFLLGPQSEDHEYDPIRMAYYVAKYLATHARTPAQRFKAKNLELSLRNAISAEKPIRGYVFGE